MNFLPALVFACALFLVAIGFFALIAAWASPGLLITPFMRWLFTGKRLAPTRANQILMGAWAVLIGGYFLLSIGGYRTLSYFAFAAWLPLALIILKRRFGPAPA